MWLGVSVVGGACGPTGLVHVQVYAFLWRLLHVPCGAYMSMAHVQVHAFL